jgi:hypothetical protein
MFSNDSPQYRAPHYQVSAATRSTEPELRTRPVLYGRSLCLPGQSHAVASATSATPSTR